MNRRASHAAGRPAIGVVTKIISEFSLNGPRPAAAPTTNRAAMAHFLSAASRRPSTGTRREGNRIWHTIVALAREAETNVVERSGGHFVQIGKSLKSWTLPIRRLHQNGCDVEGGRSRPRSFFHVDRLGRKVGSRSRDSAAGDKNERDDMKEEETLHWCSLIPS